MTVHFITNSSFPQCLEKWALWVPLCYHPVKDLIASWRDRIIFTYSESCSIQYQIVFCKTPLPPHLFLRRKQSQTKADLQTCRPCSSEVWHRLLNLPCLPSGLSSCGWLLLNSWTLSWHRFLSFVFLTSLSANKFPSSSPKYRDCFWKNLPRSLSFSTLLTLARLSPLL